MKIELDLNPYNWNWNSWAAAGRNLASGIGGAVAFGVAWHFLSGPVPSATDITQNVNDVISGAEQMMKGLAGLAAAFIMVRNAWKAAHSASAPEQMKSVVSNLSVTEVTKAADAIADPAGRKKLISAVAEMPEVKGIVTTPSVAIGTRSDKVVAKPEDVKT